MNRVMRYVLSLLLLLVLAVPAVAAPPSPLRLSEADRADIARVETYLNGIKTLRAPFVQATDDGRLVRGTFYLSRPGKMRVEYDPPIKDFVVADGLFVFFWDGELKQQSSTPIGSTLADVILRRDLKLSGDVAVTEILRQGGILEVTLIQVGDSGKGSLTLVFEDKPMRLRKWRVIDAQGLTTEVALQNPQFGIDLNRDLFIFRDPTFGQRRDN